MNPSTSQPDQNPTSGFVRTGHPPRASKKMVLAACCAIGLALAAPLHAASYSARGDFSIGSNPNGVWSYGTLDAFTGGALTSFGTAESDRDFTGERAWDNNGIPPNRAAVYDNVSGTQTTNGTVVVPTSQLILDGENAIADVRWTAPAAGTYDVTGLFQRDDVNAAPVSVRIIEDGTTALFSADGFTTNGNQQAFDLAALVLPAGTTLDFEEGAGQFNNDSTGLAATISTVPEPSSMAALLMVTGAGWLLVARGRKNDQRAAQMVPSL